MPGLRICRGICFQGVRAGIPEKQCDDPGHGEQFVGASSSREAQSERRRTGRLNNSHATGGKMVSRSSWVSINMP